MSLIDEQKAELASLTRRLAEKDEPRSTSQDGPCWAIKALAADPTTERTWWVCDNGSVSSWEHRAMFSERWRCGLVMDRQRQRRPDQKLVRVRITRKAAQVSSAGDPK